VLASFVLLKMNASRRNRAGVFSEGAETSSTGLSLCVRQNGQNVHDVQDCISRSPA
jgi:hypothetical protein